MKPCARALLFSCTTAVAVCAAHAGTVTVSFVNAPGFSDAGATRWDEGADLRALARHLEALGQRHLPPEQVLRVEILDVDLAGTVRPSRQAGRDLRIVRGGADWPRISLRYTLEVSGKPLLSGEEWLADMNYSHGFVGDRGSDPLHYEKNMLDVWFKARFVERRAAGD